MIRIEVDGHRIHTGDLFRDNIEVGARMLRVHGLDDDGCVELAIIGPDGQAATVGRGVVMVTAVSVERLTSDAFVRVEQRAGA